MKKRPLLVAISLLLTFSLTGCDFLEAVIKDYAEQSANSSQTNKTDDGKTNNNDNNKDDNKDDDSSKTDDENKDDSGNDDEQQNESSFVLDSNNLSSISSSYSDGNYGSVYYSLINYEYYRAVGGEGNYAFKLLPSNYYYCNGGYPGCFYNISPIYAIKKIDINYRSSGGIKLICARNIDEPQETSLPAVNGDYTTKSYTFNQTVNFFKICSNGYEVYVNSITIHTVTSSETVKTTATYTGNRKDVIRYTNDLVSGFSKKSMYISKTQMKEYTYYSSEWVKNRYDNDIDYDLEEICLTDPVDVCNYYMAFHEFPANYFTSDMKSTYRYIFGSYSRQVTEYNRTTGYAKSVPYNNVPGGYRPIYYELDIALDNNYSLNYRSVGRVVIWEYGFSVYGVAEEEMPVCVYTDDHYFSFQEYNNMGGFSDRFNGEGHLLQRNYCKLTTI